MMTKSQVVVVGLLLLFAGLFVPAAIMAAVAGNWGSALLYAVVCLVFCAGAVIAAAWFIEEDR